MCVPQFVCNACEAQFRVQGFGAKVSNQLCYPRRKRMILEAKKMPPRMLPYVRGSCNNTVWRPFCVAFRRVGSVCHFSPNFSFSLCLSIFSLSLSLSLSLPLSLSLALFLYISLFHFLSSEFVVLWLMTLSDGKTFQRKPVYLRLHSTSSPPSPSDNMTHPSTTIFQASEFIVPRKSVAKSKLSISPTFKQLKRWQIHPIHCCVLWAAMYQNLKPIGVSNNASLLLSQSTSFMYVCSWKR